MADQANSFETDSREEAEEMISEAAARVRADVERLVDGFDIESIVKKVDEFGRGNPVGLALTALTLGIAVGVLMKTPRRMYSK